MELDVRGASSRTLTGEIGLFEFQNVFAEVSICPETMELLQKSLRETHFEATVTRFEYSSGFRRKSKVKRSGPGRVAKGPGGPAGIRLLGLGGGQGAAAGICDPGPGEGKGPAASIWGTWPSCTDGIFGLAGRNGGRGPVGIRQLGSGPVDHWQLFP